MCSAPKKVGKRGTMEEGGARRLGLPDHHHRDHHDHNHRDHHDCHYGDHHDEYDGEQPDMI